eukprot:Protomagalhaensia_wolfi_Nauph_80__3962@NODE_4014_length_659_cov_31_519355_g3178_i0_p3_GENE_NODE_4014_length_659_cov_31_519355_g3178_i0NODE_4014_length_659_cov_31_519355_g3178_i0_p3_ORF_typecomplete_len104_score12_18_NODE_4014_length_659_cov_31_519355_g3178_i0116427
MGSRCFKGAQRYVRQEDEEKTTASERNITSPQARPVDTPDGFSAASPPFPAAAQRRRDRVRPTANRARERMTRLFRRRPSKPETFTRAPEPPDVPWPTPKWPE